MSSHGKSLLTSVGVTDNTIWIHNGSGDRQLSSEGDAFGTMFSWDGRKLYYLMQSGENGADLRPRELETGKTERAVSAPQSCPGLPLDVTASRMMASRSLSRWRDAAATSHLWLSPTDHRSSPSQVMSTSSQDCPTI